MQLTEELYYYDFPRARKQLEDLYDEGKLPEGTQLFDRHKYDLVYFDYQLSGSKPVTDIKREIMNKTKRFIKDNIETRKLLGNFSYGLRRNCSISLIQTTMDYFYKACNEETDLMLCSGFAQVSVDCNLPDESAIVRFCFLRKLK
jgi:hypothetical protein